MKRFLASLILAGGFILLPAQPRAQTSPFIIEPSSGKAYEPSPAPTVPRLREESKVVDIRDVRPFVLAAVSVEGSSVSPSKLAAAVRPFVGTLLDKDGVKRVADAIADAYRREGRIAFFSVAVPAQDFAGGALRLVALEGFVERVDIQGDAGDDIGLLKEFSAPLSAERPLLRTTLDRAITLIRQVPGLSADFRVTRGSKNGGLLLIVKVEQKRLALTVNANNRGTELLGRTAVVAHVSAYDLTGEGEQLGLTFATATSTGRYRYGAVDIAEPIGDAGTTLALSIGYLQTKPAALVGPGEAETINVSLAHPIELSSSDSWLVSAGIAGLNSTNALFGAQAADERVRAIRAGTTYSAHNPTYAASLAATASFGLDVLGARTSFSTGAVPDFQKIGARFAYTQASDLGLILRLHSAFQYAFERLPVSEFFPLGGNDFGRAFPAAAISGDQALAGSFELAWRPKLNVEQVTASELYGYLDGGEIWRLARGPIGATTESLQSAGLGIRSRFFGRLAAELELGRQLHVPSSAPGSWQVSFSTTLSAP